MGYKDITPGNKVARLLAARFIQSKEKKTLGIELSFKFEDETLTWQGWLSPAAIENTMQILTERLGFNGNETHDENGVLTDPNAFAYGKEVEIVIELQEYEGKTYPKIKYINKLGGSAYDNIEPEQIKSALGAVNFKAAFLAAKQKLPKKDEKKAEIPF